MNGGSLFEGVVVVPCDTDGNMYCALGLEENLQKKERVPCAGMGLVSFAHKYEFPGGAVDKADGTNRSEALLVAALRETAEERGMIPNSSAKRLIMLPKKFVLEQDRDGKQVEFLVNIYIWILSAKQLAWLVNVVGGVMTDSGVEMRPRDEFIVDRGKQLGASLNSGRKLSLPIVLNT